MKKERKTTKRKANNRRLKIMVLKLTLILVMVAEIMNFKNNVDYQMQQKKNHNNPGDPTRNMHLPIIQTNQ